MKLSVIIPIYNCESYLDTCLHSLQKQTYQDLEVILVNDGSTDGSQKIIDRYVSNYPSLFQSHIKENGGQASARNLGLQYAKGEFLGFVDSDDWLDFDYYEKLIHKAESENLDVVVADMIDHYDTYDVYHHASQFNDKFKMTPSACNKIFRRTICEGIGFPDKLWYEDFEFTTKILFLTTSISGVPGCCYHCHCRPVSTMTNNNSEKNLDIITVMNNLIFFLKDNNLYQQNENVIQYLIIDHILITSINRVSVQQNKNKQKVIDEMVAYCQSQCKNLNAALTSMGFSKQKAMVAKLNYRGFHKASRFLLSIKSKIKKK